MSALAKLLAASLLTLGGYIFLTRIKAEQKELERDLPTRFEGKRQALKHAVDPEASRISETRRSTTLSDIAKWPRDRSKREVLEREAPYETTVWVLEATVESIRRNEDGDLLLTLRDGAESGCAEVPEPRLSQGSKFGGRIRTVWHQLNALIPPERSEVILSRRAVLVGIGFLDSESAHKGTHSRNGAELHPLLEMIWQ